MEKNPPVNNRPVRKVRSIEFATRLIDPVQSVILTGVFTEWRPEGIPLEKAKDGLWKTTLSLPAGSYEYRLIVDGRWSDDPLATRRVPGPFGAANCVLSV